MKLLIRIINILAMFLMVVGALHIGLTVINIKLVPALCMGYVPVAAIYSLIGVAGLWGIYMLFQKNWLSQRTQNNV